MEYSNNRSYTKAQLLALVACRVLVGWHFLYEGCTKLMNPDWSARGFLLDSNGICKSWFYWMANTEDVLQTVNFLNQWGLILIGLALMLGLFSRFATIGGIIMLALFYLSHPPLIGVDYAMPSEGSYLIVNKNLIELSALIILFLFPTSRMIGVDRLVHCLPVFNTNRVNPSHQKR
ncbi:MAG: DoxX family membrane protein [Marinilabiliaceae bacterium]|nr:DoxX family membrane protein [Marinilabiliaceae bacterium]